MTPDEAAVERVRRFVEEGCDCNHFPADEIETVLTRWAPERCCNEACNGGACETCRCCCAGWCVMGTDGVPERPDDLTGWMEVAAEHNPIVAAWQADRAELEQARAQVAAVRELADDLERQATDAVRADRNWSVLTAEETVEAFNEARLLTEDVVPRLRAALSADPEEADRD
jgi:hypothetical protein